MTALDTVEKSEPNPENRLYKSAYGAWAGMPKGHQPDFKRCCEEVWSRERWSRHSQCSRPRGHGPDGAYCKQHDPAIVEARQKAVEIAGNKRHRNDMMRAFGSSFLAILRQIADGHNDPRAIASEAVRRFDTSYPPSPSTSGGTDD